MVAKNDIAIVGATSSMAQPLCHILASKGARLILVGRDENELNLLASDIHVRHGSVSRIVILDVLDESFAPDTLIEQLGNFDDMVIAVGDLPQEDLFLPHGVAYCVHVNYTAPAIIATSAAAFLAKKGHGSITVISSVAGDRGRQSNYPYGAAKAALSEFTSGLRNRYAKHGVHIMTVKPGFIDTPMTWALGSPLIADRNYAARVMAHAIEKKKDSIYVPFFWRYIMLIICLIPERIFKKLSL